MGLGDKEHVGQIEQAADVFLIGIFPGSAFEDGSASAGQSSRGSRWSERARSRTPQLIARLMILTWRILRGENIMVAQPFGDGNELLSRVREGMAVVDAADTYVGTVRQIYLGTPERNEMAPPDDPALDAIPAALRARLAVSGYLAITSGADRVDCYALGEQVAEVTADHVRLAVGVATLPRR
jgi:hypothetical protein